MEDKKFHINRRSSHLAVWKFILTKISSDIVVMLLYVLESEGSSPGRAGFKMAVAADGSSSGTIGGGIMEHKLTEKAKSLLQKNETKIILQKQFHDKEASTDQSGMICSGSQLNVFVPLNSSHKKMIESFISGEKKSVRLNAETIAAVDQDSKALKFTNEDDWEYTERIDNRPALHIIGGGHVSIALSELMSFVGFHIKVYDDRPMLNTMADNHFTDEQIVIASYEKLNEYLVADENDFAVIMTVGYRTDKMALLELLQRKFAYLGMMGSDHKIQTLFTELKSEGVDADLLQNIAAPIGINILSKTTQEIAVSIAAEIIRERNKELPTGRKNP